MVRGDDISTAPGIMIEVTQGARVAHLAGCVLQGKYSPQIVVITQLSNQLTQLIALRS